MRPPLFPDALAALALVVAGLVAPSATRAATVATVNPSADTFVTTGPSTGDLSNNNYGAAGALSVAAPGKPTGEFQSVLRFDLSSVKSTFDAAYGPGKWSVQSATLTLTASSPNNAIFNTTASGSFAVTLMSGPSGNAWAEGTGTPKAGGATTDGISFNSLPTYVSASDPSLGTFTFNGVTSGSTTYALGLPAAFTADVTAGGLASLRLAAADPNVSYLFNSREFGTATARPQLTVTAVPEPAGAALAALAGAALFLRIPRRRQS